MMPTATMPRSPMRLPESVIRKDSQKPGRKTGLFC
jgi:hypothetical protein